jgi:hypothetical protein
MIYSAMITRFLLLCLFTLSFLIGIPATNYGNNNDTMDLESLDGVHPRLFVTESVFDELQQRNWDPLGQRYRTFLSDAGNAMLEIPLVPYEYAGYRLLQQSRKIVKRVTTLSLLYRLEKDPRYRDRAIRELENAVAFPSWNPRHFLDTGELALAVAIGTDWLWDELNEDQRNRFLDALKEKAILPSLDESHPHNWWLYYYNNWNPVCHTGLTAAALLLAEREPELAERVIRRAIGAFPATLESYQPDGAYPEGPGYWDYGTSFSGLLLNLLDRAFGSTFGLDDDPAFRASATFRAAVVTPTERFYNYADGYPNNQFTIGTAWHATRYKDAAAEYEMRRGLAAYLDRDDWIPDDGKDWLLAFLALWYPDSQENADDDQSKLPNIWLGRGQNPIAFVREAWESHHDFFLGFKGNDGSVSHAHLDAGSFILEDEGIRWAVDLGSQNYNSVESLGFGLWDRRQHSDRWNVFRLGSYSHNVLLIDQRQQGAEAKADIVSLEQKGKIVEGIVDLTPIYAGQAKDYKRTFRVHDFKVLEVIDNLEGARERTEQQGRTPATLRWRMVTEADVTVDGSKATLKQDGKTLHLVVSTPTEGLLRAAPVDPPPYFWDAENPGVTAIDFWCKATNAGDQTVRVLMSTDAAALRARRVDVR